MNLNLLFIVLTSSINSTSSLINVACLLALIIFSKLTRTGFFKGAQAGGEPGIFFGFRLFSLSKAAP